MVHSLESIAHSRYLDPTKFTEFVTVYQVNKLTTCKAITSWDVDEVVEDYKFFIGESEYMADRNEFIKIRMGKNAK